MTCDLVSRTAALVPASVLTTLPGQERPCTRCIKRNIGHLCHDEPREGVKRTKTDPESSNGEKSSSMHEATPADGAVNPMAQQPTAPDAGLTLAPPPPPVPPPEVGANAAAIVQSAPVSAPQLPALASQSPSRKLHIRSALGRFDTELTVKFSITMTGTRRPTIASKTCTSSILHITLARPR